MVVSVTCFLVLCTFDFSDRSLSQQFVIVLVLAFFLAALVRVVQLINTLFWYPYTCYPGPSLWIFGLDSVASFISVVLAFSYYHPTYWHSFQYSHSGPCLSVLCLYCSVALISVIWFLLVLPEWLLILLTPMWLFINILDQL